MEVTALFILFMLLIIPIVFCGAVIGHFLGELVICTIEKIEELCDAPTRESEVNRHNNIEVIAPIAKMRSMSTPLPSNPFKEYRKRKMSSGPK